jgi:hypothetical protein
MHKWWEPLKFWGLVLLLVVSACLALIATVTPTPSLAADYGVEMMRAPGLNKPIPMPSKDMRLVIEQEIADGRGPLVVWNSQAELQHKCRKHTVLLGCATQTGCRLGIIFLLEGMNSTLEHMARVHEHAHCKGWKHN